MSWKIGMPNLGHTMEVGTVSQWLKAAGDTVAKGEVIVIVETDKASFDVESPGDGTLAQIHALAGTEVAVGASIGLVVAAGESAVTREPPQSAPQESVSPAPATAEPPPTEAPRARRGSISPAARVLAETLGVQWEGVRGSGDDGMLTRDDIRALAASGAADTRPIPLSPMRRAIAQATELAWRSIPHVPLKSHADVSALLLSRGDGLTAAITRACALALREHPAFNGWLVDNAFEQARHADIAMAVSTPGGLVTAVVAQAESKSVPALAAEISVLAVQAREGRLDGSRMTGGSFTVSSLGRWGVDNFAPIIAAPQVAILGVGRVNRVAREAADGGVHFASEIGLTLVFDHRANDGVEAARMLASIVACQEQPERLELIA